MMQVMQWIQQQICMLYLVVENGTQLNLAGQSVDITYEGLLFEMKEVPKLVRE